jgi:hypothetical protein
LASAPGHDGSVRHDHGVSTVCAVRIFKNYGAEAITIITDNPYRLARDIRGIGFRSADAIAERPQSDAARQRHPAISPSSPAATPRMAPPSCCRSSHSCPLWARPDPGRPGPLFGESGPARHPGTTSILQRALNSTGDPVLERFG